MTIHLSKVNQFGGGNGGGGGSSSFPIIVTDSGSSLPSASGYQEGDTFLNTSDKKIYGAKYDGYELNTGTTNSRFSSQGIDYGDYVTINKYTGVASGFYYSNSSFIEYNSLYRGSLTDLRWKGEKEYKVHFKLTLNPAGWHNLFYISNSVGYAQYGENSDIITVGLYNGKLYIQAFHLSSSMGSGSYTTIKERIEILDSAFQNNTEYYITIKKKDSIGTIETSVSSTSYTENIIETKITETTINDVADYSSNSTYFYYGFKSPYNSQYVSDYISNYGSLFTIGEIYLLDSSGEFLKQSSDLVWDSGTSLTDKTEYADKTNGILYLYQDEELTQIPLIDLSNYKLKATTTTIDTASVTVSEIKANTNYVFSNNAITDITLSGCETSFEETTIEFTTGSTAPTLTDNSGITWVDGSAPTLNASKSYIIVIFNKIGFVKEY